MPPPARTDCPEGPGPFPAVLEVHGGAWTMGDRFNNVSIAEHLAGHGIVVLSIEFRMPPQARYPETVADVNFGIRFLKANAREVPDPERSWSAASAPPPAGTCCC